MIELDFGSIFYQILALSLYSKEPQKAGYLKFRRIPKIISYFVGLSIVMFIGLINISLNAIHETQVFTLKTINEGQGDTLIWAALINYTTDSITATALYLHAILTQDSNIRMINRLNYIQGHFMDKVNTRTSNMLFGLYMIANLFFIAYLYATVKPEPFLIWRIMYLIVLYISTTLTIRLTKSLYETSKTITEIEKYLRADTGGNHRRLGFLLNKMEEVIDAMKKYHRFPLLIVSCRLLVTNVVFINALCFLVSEHIVAGLISTVVINVLPIGGMNVLLLLNSYFCETTNISFTSISRMLGDKPLPPLLRASKPQYRDCESLRCLFHRKSSFNIYGLFAMNREFAFMVS